MPLIPHRLYYLGSSAWSKRLTFEGSSNRSHTGSHYTRLILKHGTVYEQDKHQFDYTVCKCTNNIRGVNERVTMIGKSPTTSIVTSIPASRNPDTPEGLKSWLSVRIHKILAELSHSTELELGKLHRTWMDSFRASALELLRGLPTSHEVLRPSEHCPSLYSTKDELGKTIGS
jgi:hypothetical protein